MMFTLSTKSITLLLAASIAATTEANLRSRRATTLFGDEIEAGPISLPEASNLRGSAAGSATASDDAAAAAEAAEPSGDTQEEIDFPLEDPAMIIGAEANNTIASANGLDTVSTYAAPSGFDEISMLSVAGTQEVMSKKYQGNENQGSVTPTVVDISVDFSIPNDYGVHLAEYEIGIFMRMDVPQGFFGHGALDYLPLCSTESTCNVTADRMKGSVTFDLTSLDLDSDGSRFDVYILDGRGSPAVGPCSCGTCEFQHKGRVGYAYFNIRMNNC